jgi:hypothetical protein
MPYGGLSTGYNYSADNIKRGLSKVDTGDEFQDTFSGYSETAKKYLDPGGLFSTITPEEKHAQGLGIAGNINEANFGVPRAGRLENSLRAQVGEAAARQTPGLNAGQITQGSSDYLNMLQQQAAGQGPSAAQVQLQQALSRNVANQQALAASARPGNTALAARMASQQAGALGGSLAGQGALARVQEQLGAQQQLGQALQTNQGAFLQGQGQGDAVRGQAMQQRLNLAQLQQQGGLERERLRNQYYNAGVGYGTDAEQRRGLVGGLLGGIFSGGKSLGGQK